ncbi:MAG: hypothetical protein ABSE25_00765 [Syntrophorhabdales bacterium]|jgi:hypothetical protein
MELLVALEPIVIRPGDIIKPGEIVQARRPERLLSEGKARRLNRAESQRILDRYVAEAREVFEAEGPLVCHACKGTDFWTSVHGVVVCRRCHPPMRDGLIKKWIGEATGRTK